MPKRHPKRRRNSVRRLGRWLLRAPNLFAAAVLGAVLGFGVLLAVSLATQGSDGPDRLDEIASAGRA